MNRYTVVCDRGHESEIVGRVFVMDDIFCTKMVKGERCNQKMRRKFTPPYIVFKGKGFYKTDNPK